MLGHRRQGGRQAGLRAPRRPRARAAARLHVSLSRETGDAADVYIDPALAAERAAEYAAAGFTALKFDPLGPYSAFDPRQPSLEALERTEAYVAARARGGRRPLRPARRHARSVHAVGRDPAGAPARAPTTRSGSRSPSRPTPGGDGPRRASDVDPDRHRRAADDEVRVRARPRTPVPRRSCSSTSVGSVACSRAKKIAGLAEAHYAQIAPHLYCGPIVGAANIQLAACSPNFLVLEGILDWGGFHAELLRRRSAGRTAT